MITEDDYRYGTNQYAVHKMFNEFQAQDYNEKHGMTITGVRPANVTGPDKVRGSSITSTASPSRRAANRCRSRSRTRCAARFMSTTSPRSSPACCSRTSRRHSIYNTGGTAISLGDLADIVRGYLPDARISFEHDTGGKDASGNYLIDNRRLVEEFGIQYRPFPQRVLQIINEIRAQENRPAIVG